MNHEDIHHNSKTILESLEIPEIPEKIWKPDNVPENKIIFDKQIC